ncbi:hypothetical protein JHK86_035194 [Glycine max]|nr:hypothetical protein JHK86_035194 [Glycine max]
MKNSRRNPSNAHHLNLKMNDVELLKDIVRAVSEKLPRRYQNQSKGLVGIEEHYKRIESFLNNGSSEVRTLGIWGMGGIGKSTLATALYNELSPEFEGHCFFINVFDKSEMSNLQGKRVFIVLDDVATSEQLEKLIGEYDFLGLGSRVIVTSRNKQMLSLVDEIYSVEELSSHHSLQLFCLTVFGEEQPKDGYEDLSRRGTDVVEGIILNLHKLTGDLFLSSDSLAKMTNLRFLRIHKGWRSNNQFNVFLSNGLESLSNKLRYLHWDECCLESLPSNFCAEQLVEISMPRSKLKKLWDGVQNLVSLKTIDLQESRDLIEIPDLFMAKKLERVYLNHCKSLYQIHLNSKSLYVLDLLGCSSLKEFTVTSEEMIDLMLSHTAICTLSSPIDHLLSLEVLDLSGTNVEILPANIKNLSMMRKLKLDDFCTKLMYLPELPPSLTELHLNNCQRLMSLPKLPSSLRELHLNNCWRLVSLPKLPPSLRELHLNNFWRLMSLPKIPPSLRELHLNNCRRLVSLPKLPPGVKEVSAINCISLKTDITQRLVLQHMYQSRIPYLNKDPTYREDEYFFFPGDHVTNSKYGFHTEESSITIPYLPKSHLCGFIYCIILLEGSVLKDNRFSSAIYRDDMLISLDHRRIIGCEKLISDHQKKPKKKIVCPSKQDSEDSVTVTVVVVDQRIISQECVDHLQEVLLSLVSSVRLAGTDRKQKRPVQIMHTQDLVSGMCACGNKGIMTLLRDQTIRLWSDQNNNHKFVSSKILLGYTSFVGPLEWIPPNTSFLQGHSGLCLGLKHG